MSPCKSSQNSVYSEARMTDTVPLHIGVHASGNRLSTVVKVLLLLVCCVAGILLATLWVAFNNSLKIAQLQDERSIAMENVESLLTRVKLLEDSLEQIMMIEMDEEEETEELATLVDQVDEDSTALIRRKRSPETLRRPSRYMTRPVPVYNRAYGVDFKNEGDGLKLYSSLQNADDVNSIDGSIEKQKSSEVRRRRPPPASFLKSGDRIRRRRPAVKSLVSSRQPPTPSGGLVKNNDVLYRESLYKDTPGDDAWDDAVSKVKQGTSSPAYLSQSASAPVFVAQKRSHIRKRPRKKNSVRRRRGSRTTAAHFNGLPDATGSDGVWEAAEWMEGLGLTSRYKSGGDHVTVSEPGIYLLYAQVKLALTNRAAGFDIKVNSRSAASCAHISDSYASTCYTSAVAYLPKNSVVRVESHTPESPILRLQDGEQASLGLIKLLDAPESYHKLFSA